MIFQNIPMFVTFVIPKYSFLPVYRCPGAILHFPEHFSAVPAHVVSRDQKCS